MVDFKDIWYMQPVTVNPVSPQYLSNLDKEQLIDVLQHRTKLLVTASRLLPPSHTHIKELTTEVREIQSALRSRN